MAKLGENPLIIAESVMIKPVLWTEHKSPLSIKKEFEVIATTTSPASTSKY